MRAFMRQGDSGSQIGRGSARAARHSLREGLVNKVTCQNIFSGLESQVMVSGRAPFFDTAPRLVPGRPRPPRGTVLTWRVCCARFEVPRVAGELFLCPGVVGGRVCVSGGGWGIRPRHFETVARRPCLCPCGMDAPAAPAAAAAAAPGTAIVPWVRAREEIKDAIDFNPQTTAVWHCQRVRPMRRDSLVHHQASPRGDACRPSNGCERRAVHQNRRHGGRRGLGA